MSPLGKLSLLLGLTTLAILLILTVGRSTQLVRAATPVYADIDGSCATLTPCFDTIQAAVENAEPPPAQVFVFPGAYAESVDLDSMETPGDISLTTVDASGTPTPGTVTVSPASGEAFEADCTFPGSITIDGFTVLSLDTDGIDLCADGDITIKNVTANDNDSDGVDVNSEGNLTVTNVTANGNSSDGVDAGGSGSLTITDSTANDNGDNGFDNDVDGDVAVSGSSADGNEDEGFDIDGFEFDATGDVTVNDSSADGNDDDGFEIDAGSATITNSTANDNADEGFQSLVSGDTLYDGVTAIGNLGDGVDAEGASIDEEGDSAGNVTVRNSNIQENDSGVEMLESGTAAGTLLVNGNIICGNTTSGLASLSDVSVNSEGNWWGAASGPTHPSNGAGTGDAVLDAANPGDLSAQGTVDFTPWIDTVSGSGSAVVGQASNITFQFTGGSGAVSLQQGPGDASGPPTFAASTNNGTASTSGFVSGGSLTVSLTAATVGTANVTVTGPCGITGSFAAAVAAAPVAPTPTPTPTAVLAVQQLPTTGGTPSDGGSLPWLAIAAGVIALTSGGLALAYRTRRIR